MNKTELKELVGRTVYLIGTGNNAQRNGSSPVKRATLEKVGPKNCYLRMIYEDGTPSNAVEKLRMSDGDASKLANDFYGGYRLFQSFMAVEEYQASQNLGRRVWEHCSSLSRMQSLDYATLSELAKILKI